MKLAPRWWCVVLAACGGASDGNNEVVSSADSSGSEIRNDGVQETAESTLVVPSPAVDEPSPSSEEPVLAATAGPGVRTISNGTCGTFRPSLHARVAHACSREQVQENSDSLMLQSNGQVVAREVSAGGGGAAASSSCNLREETGRQTVVDIALAASARHGGCRPHCAGSGGRASPSWVGGMLIPEDGEWRIEARGQGTGGLSNACLLRIGAATPRRVDGGGWSTRVAAGLHEIEVSCPNALAATSCYGTGNPEAPPVVDERMTARFAATRVD